QRRELPMQQRHEEQAAEERLDAHDQAHQQSARAPAGASPRRTRQRHPQHQQTRELPRLDGHQYADAQSAGDERQLRIDDGARDLESAEQNPNRDDAADEVDNQPRYQGGSKREISEGTERDDEMWRIEIR